MRGLNLFQAASCLVMAIGGTLAAPARSPIKHIGNQSPVLTGAVATKDFVFVSGTIPSVNGTIPEGIEAQTTVILNNIGKLLEEAGTSWEYAVKTTVLLADMNDFAAMNAVYGSILPNPKPARSTFQVGKLPGDFLIEIEATAAIPRC